MDDSLTSVKGFSLVELLLVLAIIGVVASFAIPQYLVYIETAEETACLVERGQTNRTIIAFISDHQDTPFTSLAQLVGAGYFEEVPNCPHGGEWVLVTSDQSYGAPEVGCSLHYWPEEGAGPVSGTDENGEQDAGEGPADSGAGDGDAAGDSGDTSGDAGGNDDSGAGEDGSADTGSETGSGDDSGESEESDASGEDDSGSAGMSFWEYIMSLINSIFG